MNAVEIIDRGRNERRRRLVIVCIVLTILIICLGIFSLVFGRTIYSLDEVVRVIQGENIKGASFAVGMLRLPRMLAGLLAGLAFGAAGASFQSMLRNSLASPDIIGVTSGAGAAAVFCIVVLHLSGFAVSIAAVLAGLGTAMLIFILSGGGSFGGGRLILIGIGIGAMVESVISYLMLTASQWDVAGAMRWLSGSLNGTQMVKIPILVACVFILGVGTIFTGKSLRAMELGDEAATALGINVTKTRLLLTLFAVALSAVATAVTGPIAFVAFLSGPIAGRMTGEGRASAIPAALVGASLVLIADLIGQFMFSTRFPVGVITGILGAPYLIFLLIRSNKKGGSL